jgi:antitoxin Phd
MTMTTKSKRSRRKPPQFVVDEKGRRTGVLLTLRQYQSLLQRIEDLEDIQAAKEALAEEGESIPWEQVKAELHAERARR